MGRAMLAPLAAAALVLCCAAGPLIAAAIASWTVAAILGVSVAVCAFVLAVAAAGLVLRQRRKGRA